MPNEFRTDRRRLRRHRRPGAPRGARRPAQPGQTDRAGTDRLLCGDDFAEFGALATPTSSPDIRLPRTHISYGDGVVTGPDSSTADR